MSLQVFGLLIQRLSRAAVWHRSCATKFPADVRNVVAIEQLTALARAHYSDVHPQTWARLPPHFDSEHFEAASNAAHRAVGFSRRAATDIDGFVNSVADEAERLSAEAQVSA